MLKCPKCSNQVDDGSKICRQCGAILEEVVEVEGYAEKAEPVLEERALEVMGELDVQTSSGEAALVHDESGEDESSHDSDEEEEEDVAPSWTCVTCSESNPMTFDLCWKCGSGKGEANPGMSEASAEPIVHETVETQQPEPKPKTQGPRCEKCGSNKIIPGVRLADQGQGSDGKAKLVVFGNPYAVIFKDRRYSEVKANVCGECGHVELRASNPQSLYRHYRQSLQG